VLIYEGFGSSYDKARAAIAAMRTHFPDRRLIVVFEPHTFSWRNREKLYWYDDVFCDVDEVFIYKPPAIGADTHEQITQDEIVERVRRNGISIHSIANEKDGLYQIEKNVGPRDVILLLTSGNLDGLVQSIPRLMERLFPN
jgi:UDP-N-acetylmuramate: L-alanyl-gamma-D-glutamyl-meso-diaminopimelate ligase